MRIVIALAALALPHLVLADTVMFAAGAFFLIQAETGVAVPNVIGQDQGGADTLLEAVGLDTGGLTNRCSTEMAGYVVGQSPAPGVEVELGSLIDLLLSDGNACSIVGRPGVRLRGLRMPGL